MKDKSKELIMKTLHLNFNIKGKLARRYTEVLVKRAVLFYLDGELDCGVVSEDLLMEKGKFVNLEYCEDSRAEEGTEGRLRKELSELKRYIAEDKKEKS